MQPVLSFALFGRFVTVSSYSTMMYVAAVVTVSLALAIAARLGVPLKRAAISILLMAAAVPVGARLLDFATNYDRYAQTPEQLWAIDVSGFSLYGGLLLAAAVGVTASLALGLQVKRLADAVAPGLGIGLAMMRVGCFLAGCCFGTETALPWGMVFPQGSRPWLHQLAAGTIFVFDEALPVHPTQLYEMGAGVVGAVLAGWLIRRRAVDGTAFLAFIAWFSLARWANHLLRVQSATPNAPEWFYPALYAVIIAVCLVFLIKRHPVPGTVRWLAEIRGRSRPVSKSTCAIARAP